MHIQRGLPRPLPRAPRRLPQHREQHKPRDDRGGGEEGEGEAVREEDGQLECGVEAAQVGQRGDPERDALGGEGDQAERAREAWPAAGEREDADRDPAARGSRQ